MLGHVAGSVGSALPGGGASVSPIISQVLVTEDGTAVPAPAGTTFAFIEIQASGAPVGGSAAPSAGGAASDIIISAGPGDSFLFSIPFPPSDATEASVSRSGAKLISAMSPPSYSAGNTDNGSVQPAPSGKYPGGVGKNLYAGGSRPSEHDTDRGGRGGGRLAGRPGYRPAAERECPGHGSGRYGASQGAPLMGGKPVGCITFFRNYDAALAFARSCYGGTWNP